MNDPLPLAAGSPSWDWLIQDDRVHRTIYTDPSIFAREMNNIFAATWVYLDTKASSRSRATFAAPGWGRAS